MKEVLAILCNSGVPFLVIGGQGLSIHGVQRDTLDLDCLVAVENTQAISECLVRYGFEEVVRQPNFTRFRLQALLYPIVDVMHVDPSTFAKLAAGALTGRLYGHDVRIPAIPHYIALKLHAIKQNPGREDKDRADIIALIRANPGAVKPADLETLCQRYAPAGFWDTLKQKVTL